jgi:fumarylacetoacetase
LEITARGTQTITLPNGETRGFLEDGDEVMFRAHCGDGRAARIGFGECRAVIAPARKS